MLLVELLEPIRKVNNDMCKATIGL